MGKKGRSSDESMGFAPTKAVLQQMQYSAMRSGTSAPSSVPVRADKWDWNAGKLSDAKWKTPTKSSAYNDCPSLTELCTRFIASNIQLYVERDTKDGVAEKPHPPHTDPHFNVVPPAAVAQGEGSGKREIKRYHGFTYAHLAGSLAYLPRELRDEVFLHALREATLYYSQIPAYLHAGLRQLDMSKYGREFHQSFASHLLPKLDKIDTGETDNWEQIDAWTIHEAYKGCPNLTFLDLSNCIIFPHKLQQVLSACPIKNLRLVHYPLHRNLTTPSSIPLTSNHLEGLDIPFLAIPFAFNFPALSRIDLSYNRSGSPTTLMSLAEHSKKLSYLNISGTENIHSVAFTHLLKSCHNLRYLVAKDNTLRINDDLLDSTVPSKSLTSLNLSGNTFVHYDLVVRMAEKYENLRSLDVSHCLVASPSALVAQCLMVRPLLEITFGGSSVPTDE
eukprot:Phypoly_transcript_04799.p1 GENE.Phypoly_transcript_04799~~Phypoly_transcript_04799.p1  ORF type:complete len:446 (+),score=52.49 Phypoly_transcript_04799:749-2086(+)